MSALLENSGSEVGRTEKLIELVLLAGGRPAPFIENIL